MIVLSSFARVLLAGGAALALGACGPDADQDAPGRAPAEDRTALSSQAEPDDAGLAALTADEIRGAALGGELGCGFFNADEDFPVLSAMGVVASNDPAQAVVKAGGSVVELTAPGGYDAMADGAVFTGPDGAAYAVAVTGPAEGGGESPPRPATLTAEGGPADGETLEGRWVCGP